MFKAIKEEYGSILFPLIFFLVIFCLISLPNHYCFRTYAYDLGLFNNDAYSYAHFEFNKAPLMLPYRHFQNFLSDHFSLNPMLIGQFYRFFGSYTFLLFQIAIVLFGAVGFYQWVKMKFPDNTLVKKLSVWYFLSFWGIYSALSFEYHDNVTAAMLVPWLFYFFEIRKYGYVFLFTFLILVSKENMALWAFFIFMGLAFSSFNDRRAFYTALSLALISIVYFIVVVKWIIPSMNMQEEKGYLHFKYSVLGTSFRDVFSTLVHRPIYFISLLFKSHVAYPDYKYIKMFTHIFVLLSGGIFLFWKPRYFIMLIPIYLQKLYHDETVKWGPAIHYSIEFVPIVAFATFSFIADLKNQKFQNRIAIAVTGTTILATVMVYFGLGSTKYDWDKEGMYFFSEKHYTREYDLKEVYKDLELIPGDAILSVNSPLAPHLAYRKFIYSFPYIENATYIALIIQKDSNYPMEINAFNEKVDSLKKDIMVKNSW